MSTFPRLLRGLVDDAAVFPPGNATLPAAIDAHRRHRAAWYAPLVGPLLLRFSQVGEAGGLVEPGERPAVGLIGDGGLDALDAALGAAAERFVVRQVEMPVALRGEDPLPGLRDLLNRVADWPAEMRVYAEIPLTFGCMAALDEIADARAEAEMAGGELLVAPKFRTGGLVAELFPSVEDLAGVLAGCAERDLPVKLTAGLHRAVRYTDRETGFTHHGYLNVLAASLAPDRGEMARLLGTVDAAELVAVVRPRLGEDRELWVGYGSCSVTEPLDDLIHLGLLEENG